MGNQDVVIQDFIISSFSLRMFDSACLAWYS